MSLLELQLFPEEPLHEQKVVLSGREYTIRTDYNGREDRWFIYLCDASGTMVSGPMKIVCGKPLLRYARWKPSCPPGELIAIDPSGTRESPGDPPTWADLGRRVRLFYDNGISDAPTSSTATTSSPSGEAS